MVGPSLFEMPSYDHQGLVSLAGGRRYKEWAPDAALAPLIARTWICRVDPTRPEPLPHRVLPDSCVEIVADVNAPDRLTLVGPSSRAYVVPLDPCAAIVGVRLRLGVAPLLFGKPTSELRDRFETIPLPQPGWAEGSAEACFTALQAWVAARVPERIALHPELEAFVRALLSAPTEMTLKAVASHVGVGERQIRREFDQVVGLGPKRFRRVQRLWAVLSGKRNAPDTPWGEIAAGLGFADHGHLDREFVALTGQTPTAWWAEFGL